MYPAGNPGQGYPAQPFPGYNPYGAQPGQLTLFADVIF